MNDIVERLQHDPDNPDVRIWIARGKLALAEIMRLRADLEIWKRNRADLEIWKRNGGDILQAVEIERLQELLRSDGANRYWEGRWRDAEAETKQWRAIDAELCGLLKTACGLLKTLVIASDRQINALPTIECARAVIAEAERR